MLSPANELDATPGVSARAGCGLLLACCGNPTALARVQRATLPTFMISYLAAVLLCCHADAPRAGASVQSPPRCVARCVPERSRALFAFHSNFWLNLHHFLLANARLRRGLDPRRPAVVSVARDTMAIATLSDEEQRTWRAVVAYYDSAVARRDVLFDSAMVATNLALSRFDSDTSVAPARLNPALAAVLQRAAPIYRRVWWPRHDVANRAWIDAMEGLLATVGDSIAARESAALRHPWSSTAVRVDVTSYATWAGAYTTARPAHITVSSLNPAAQNDDGLEILFHEVLHTMDDELVAALDSAFRSRGAPLPRDPTHPFVF